ncbi:MULTISPECIES: hypothetical protein [Streptomyces]|uniref:hypothetical protein n=1 Tax=Streptomyces TaxID=1883 RepID=UPI00131E203F|nr:MULTISPECIES: hypothetical protein [Streptomyces]MDX3275545.1 hypothetical protein [Streptomyces scabiei]
MTITQEHTDLSDVESDEAHARECQLAVSAARGRTAEQTTVSDVSTGAVKLLTWYIQHRPGETAAILGDICLKTRVRLGVHPSKTGEVLRRSFHLDSGLDGRTIDTLLDMALPSAAQVFRKR